jgi:hypothetical protein
MTLGFVLMGIGGLIGVYFIWRGVNKLVNKLFGKEAIHGAEDLVDDFKNTKEVNKILKKGIR